MSFKMWGLKSLFSPLQPRRTRFFLSGRPANISKNDPGSAKACAHEFRGNLKVRREYHQSFAQPGFHAEEEKKKRGAILGIFCLFSCVSGR